MRNPLSSIGLNAELLEESLTDSDEQDEAKDELRDLRGDVKFNRRILQNDELDSAFVGLDLPKVPLPGYTGDPWFLPIIGGWYRFLDRFDRLRA